MTELVEAADDKLFQLNLKLSQLKFKYSYIIDEDPQGQSHSDYSLLSPIFDNRYNLRKKHHNRELLPKTLICSI